MSSAQASSTPRVQASNKRCTSQLFTFNSDNVTYGSGTGHLNRSGTPCDRRAGYSPVLRTPGVSARAIPNDFSTQSVGAVGKLRGNTRAGNGTCNESTLFCQGANTVRKVLDHSWVATRLSSLSPVPQQHDAEAIVPIIGRKRKRDFAWEVLTRSEVLDVLRIVRGSRARSARQLSPIMCMHSTRKVWVPVDPACHPFTFSLSVAEAVAGAHPKAAHAPDRAPGPAPTLPAPKVNIRHSRLLPLHAPDGADDGDAMNTTHQGEDDMDLDHHGAELGIAPSHLDWRVQALTVLMGRLSLEDTSPPFPYGIPDRLAASTEPRSSAHGLGSGFGPVSGAGAKASGGNLLRRAVMRQACMV